MGKVQLDTAGLAEIMANNASLNTDSSIRAPIGASVYHEKPESQQNSTILTGIRDILTREVKRIEKKSENEALVGREADILLKLTKIYQALEVESAKEALKHNLEGKTEEELKAMAAE